MATSNGPYRFGASFGVILLGSFRLVASSQTFDPRGKGVKRGLSFIQVSCALFWASWAALLASFIAESLCSMEGTLVLRVGWWIWGVYPMSKSNGVLFVVADGQEFFVYCARGSHVCQLSCCMPQKILRYCSSVWFVLSLAPSVWGW